MSEIFKIQRPLFTTDKKPQALAYNKDKSVVHKAPLTRELLSLFGDAYKIYFTCELQGENLVLGDRCEVQDW